MVVAGAEGVREIPAGEFFTGAMSTVILPEELLTEVRFPVAEDGDGFGFSEIARRHGDFALAGAAVRVRTTSAGSQARITCFGISDQPVTRDVSEHLRSALDATDTYPAESDLRRALADHADGIADDVVDTGGDAHASAAYRRRLIAGLVSRQVARAYLKSLRPIREGESS
jgi:carbon-monoxide dehydrogenase medium subunit